MISIVIPVYNVETYLRKCLDSVISQTYTDFEVVLIDDGSTDGSGNICDEYAIKDSRIRVYHNVNQGVSETRNQGIDYARGEWVLFVDSDDWIDVRLLEICSKWINKDIDLDICFFGYVEVTSEKKDFTVDENCIHAVKVTRDDFIGLQYRIFNRDRYACCNRNLIKLSSPCKLYRRDLLLKYRIRFQKNLVNGEDGVFNLYAYQHAKNGVCIEEPLYFYRKREDSVTHCYTEKVEENFNDLHKAYCCFIEKSDSPELYEKVYKERLVWSLSFCCILKYCHPNSPFSYKQRKEQFLEEYYKNYYKEIQDVKLNNFCMKKKIIFYFIKRRNFFMVSILCALQRMIER